MNDLQIDINGVLSFIDASRIESLHTEAEAATETLLNRTGRGKEYTGWLDLPETTTDEFLDDIIQTANKIQLTGDILVVTGIGGSYLGARAVIESLQHHFASMVTKCTTPHIIYAGNNLSSDYLSDLLEILDCHDYNVCIISKSGTTTEPAIAFRILHQHLEKKYGKKAIKDRIIAITDKTRGALRSQAEREGYKSYSIPDNVGGRYSVLTPVGLLPIAAAGFDIKQLVAGARHMRQLLFKTQGKENPATTYAAIRQALYRNGTTTEIMVHYEPRLHYFIEWWKQLFGESEGKEGHGIFPAGVCFTTDLHSMGQYIQEAQRNIFETVIHIEDVQKEVTITTLPDDSDQLNYLAGKSVKYINHQAEKATQLAHIDGGVPNILLRLSSISEYTLGQLIYFFEFACGIGGYIMKINPFDQPGVEAYKKNMFALLKKPGYEKATKEINKRIKE